ncbi:unnamed protein product, partial [Urochloa humidicola]
VCRIWRFIVAAILRSSFGFSYIGIAEESHPEKCFLSSGWDSGILWRSYLSKPAPLSPGSSKHIDVAQHNTAEEGPTKPFAGTAMRRISLKS